MRYQTAVQVQHFYEQLLQRLKTVPGVIAATETSTLPPYGGIGSEADVPGKSHAGKWRAFISYAAKATFQP